MYTVYTSSRDTNVYIDTSTRPDMLISLVASGTHSQVYSNSRKKLVRDRTSE